ncbi:MAG: sulfatase [Phycisphaeraceae bacterium]
MKHIARILALLLAWTAPDAVHAETDPQHNRYNVLFIAVDDLRPELGCYGIDYVDTPHIDKLAATGVTFLQHFVAVPTCGSSRYALLTGRSPLSSGVRHSQNNALYSGPTALKQEQQPGAQTLPELFNRSGYHTTLIGKISHTADGKVTAYNGTGDKRPELPGAWDDFATPYGPWNRGWGIFFAYADGKHREDGQGHRNLLEFTVDKDTDLPDGLMAETAIEKLKELKDKASEGEPFFMGLGFFKPHLPFVAPKQDWDAVAKWDVPEPAFPQGMDSKYVTKRHGEFYRYAMPWEKTQPLALEDAMQAKRGYLACVRYTDRQIGKLLDALDELGLADNTVVVLWGDHGYFLGEGGTWSKHSPLETALHSPLIIRAPGPGMKQGLKTDAIASTIDIYPTLVDLCKPAFTKTTHKLDGYSLLPVITGEQPSGVNKYVISTWGKATTIRTLKHRLIYRRSNGEAMDIELYDFSEHGKGAFVDLAKQQPDLTQGLVDFYELPLER